MNILKSCILCGKIIKNDKIFTYNKSVNNLNYEFTFDKEDCFLFFKRLASVYGEAFENDALCSVEKCLLIK